jgi:type II secretory pathway pseudopilin PulG
MSENATKWIPTIVAIVGILITSATTLSVVSSKFARLEAQVAYNTGQLCENELRIRELQEENKAVAVQFAEIKKDLEYIKVQLIKLIQEE